MHHEELLHCHTKFREIARALTVAIDENAVHLKALRDDAWNTATPPDNRRTVLVRHRRQGHTQRTIIAFYGSEGKWCAFDHDDRITYLDDGVIGWREIPQ